MTLRCKTTDMELGSCAGACCRPDLKQYQPIPEVWMRVTEPAGRPVVPSRADIAAGNVHALLQVVTGRAGRPEVADMVRELCESSAHQTRYDLEQAPNVVPVRRGKRKQKPGRKYAPRYHRTVEPPLLVQLRESVSPSSSAEAGASRPASSRPAARLDAIDTANRIDHQASTWLSSVVVVGLDSIGRVRRAASLLPGLENCNRNRPARDAQNQIVCCKAHQLEHDITRWWTWARVVTGWDAPAWQPDSTCPLCGTRGSIRIRLDLGRATCINDQCRETWDDTNLGLLAEHIRRENNDTEEAS